MQYVADVIRISLNNGLAAGAPNQEYFYHLSGKRWSGPHTFPASLIQPVGSTFYMAPLGVTGSLWVSNAVPGLTNTYTENGNPLQWLFETPLLPNTGDMCEHSVIEQSINIALNATDQYTFSFLDEQSSIISSVTIAGTGSSTLWGSFNWGACNRTIRQSVSLMVYQWCLSGPFSQGAGRHRGLFGLGRLIRELKNSGIC